MKKTICSCGYHLDFVATSFNSIEKRKCPRCGRIFNVDRYPVDFERIKKMTNTKQKRKRG